MTNNYVNKLSYISFSLVQSKGLNGVWLLYLLTNLKVNSFLHEIKWDSYHLPIFCYVIKGGRSLCKKSKQY